MNRDVLSIILFAEIPQLLGKKKVQYCWQENLFKILTEREDWTGKYLKQGYAVQTKNQLFSLPDPTNSLNTHFIIQLLSIETFAYFV